MDKYGITAVEFFETDLFLNILEPEVQDPTTEEISQILRDTGVSITSISAENDLTSPIEKSRSRDLQRLDRWIDISPQIGFPVIRINSGWWFDEVEGRKRLADGIEKLLRKASENNVRLAIENHPKDIANPADTDAILEIVKDMGKYFGTCPDVGHIKCDSDSGNVDNAPSWLTESIHREKCGCLFRYLQLYHLFKYAFHAHVKFGKHAIRSGDPTIDYRIIGELAREAGYQGYFSIEYVGDSPPHNEIHKAIETLRCSVSEIGYHGN
ncbi:MAG: TIM barrel protein [Planctomycetes bacterium]|nr:TIM barrel protein [Planctomycetota bacterium]